MDTSKFTPLNATEHKQLTYRQLNHYTFAAGEHIAPLLSTELIKASKCFPIVFSLDGLAVPFALLSLEQGKNPCVQEDGRWQGNYIPLHFRRYPFMLALGDDANRAVLIDPDAPQLHDAQGDPLYVEEGGQFKPSQALEEVKRGLQTFHETFEATKKLVTILRDAGVLVPVELRIQQTESSEREVASGIAVVDLKKVNQLDEQVKQAWAKLGLMKLIELHANSIVPLMRKPRQ